MTPPPQRRSRTDPTPVPAERGGPLDPNPTRPGLLLAARDPNDTRASGEFDRTYRPLVFAWCRGLGLARDDADELTNDVLLEVARRLRTFCYDPAQSFRGWLHTRTRQRVIDHYRRNGRRPAVEPLGPREDALAAPSPVVTDEDAPETPDPALEERLRHIRHVQDRVKRRVNESTWEVFWAVQVEGRPLSEAAQGLGLRYSNAFNACKRVLRMLRAEAQGSRT
ncbi:MAG: sigma-70 family RNA polymerase sigma factor [Isosphaeraceae bacterium]